MYGSLCHSSFDITPLVKRKRSLKFITYTIQSLLLLVILAPMCYS